MGAPEENGSVKGTPNTETPHVLQRPVVRNGRLAMTLHRLSNVRRPSNFMQTSLCTALLSHAQTGPRPELRVCSVSISDAIPFASP